MKNKRQKDQKTHLFTAFTEGGKMIPGGFVWAFADSCIGKLRPGLGRTMDNFTLKTTTGWCLTDVS